MKYLTTLFFVLLSVSLCLASCGSDPATTRSGGNTNRGQNIKSGNKMKITIGTKVFTATLNDNATAKAFKAMLPLTLDMKELNGNEKCFNLSKSLTVNSSNPGTIQNGDLMIYGSSTLVLFYKSFPTSYSYTKIGRVDNISGLAEALGSKHVTVKYELE
ncbi:hypothetical protein QF042_003269 [Pedobacter sp. W3I1]|uniref:cyclophilin-like fold protein n=1 Tax=Pedobacter sp. W3I1 TaxID=3042291 RepID=UPI002782C9FF|nr:cyclophilin-like fold protein [Pedobacter sp. W3I1]MDQ0639704.1 hypothetical protein [Pedobacter sp. W3I1]